MSFFSRISSLVGMVLLGCAANLAHADVVFSSIPPVPGGGGTLNGITYADPLNQFDAFGDAVQLEPGTGRELTTVLVAMANYAKHSQYMGFGDANGYTHPITLTLYSIVNNMTGPGDVPPNYPIASVGSVIATKTVNQVVPWLPESGPETATYFGVDFDFTADNVTLPESLIVGLSFASYNLAAGPYDVLTAVTGDAPGQPTVGDDLQTTLVYTAQNGGPFQPVFYLAGGILGPPGPDEPYTLAMQINVVPEASSILFGGVAACAAGLGYRRRKQ